MTSSDESATPIGKSRLCKVDDGLFAARRRALMEAEGAAALTQSLEQAAKKLPKPKAKSKKRDTP